MLMPAPLRPDMTSPGFWYSWKSPAMRCATISWMSAWWLVYPPVTPPPPPPPPAAAAAAAPPCRLSTSLSMTEYGFSSYSALRSSRGR